MFNVITGTGPIGSKLAEHPDVDKIGFTGSTQVGQMLRRLTAGTGKKISLELGGKSPFIVFDSADIDSAVEGVVDAIWFNQGQVCSAGSRVLVQEGIHDKLVHKIKERMTRLRLSDSLDKSTDMGAIVDPSQVRNIKLSSRLCLCFRLGSVRRLKATWRAPARRVLMCTRPVRASRTRAASIRRL